MNVIFSRKGVDSGSGGCASPIVEGVPISLPIPTTRPGVTTTYRALGLGDLFEAATRMKRSADETCHEDPMFGDNICGFGQVGIAQNHLAKRGVGIGDVFLFFGLYSDQDGRNRHHRIFGYLHVDNVILLGSQPSIAQNPAGLPRVHPHLVGQWNPNNALYVGKGKKARHADRSLRLSADEKQISIWNVPAWLKEAGLSYHSSPKRWLDGGRLQTVAKGQEFIATLTKEGQMWLNGVMAAIDR